MNILFYLVRGRSVIAGCGLESSMGKPGILMNYLK